MNEWLYIQSFFSSNRSKSFNKFKGIWNVWKIEELIAMQQRSEKSHHTICTWDGMSCGAISFTVKCAANPLVLISILSIPSVACSTHINVTRTIMPAAHTHTHTHTVYGKIIMMVYNRMFMFIHSMQNFKINQAIQSTPPIITYQMVSVSDTC